jgi:hypothetical protein
LDKIEYFLTGFWFRPTPVYFIDSYGISHFVIRIYTTVGFSSLPTPLANNLNTLVSAMAQCPWTYYEIAQKLAKVNVRTPVYKKWVRFYSSEESRRQVNEIKELLNKLSTQVDDEQKVIMKDHFATACNYELQFWNMAYSSID